MSTELKSELRQKQTKAGMKAARAAGKIPAVVYGKNFAPVSIEVSAEDLRLLFVAGKRFDLIDLDIPGQGVKQVFIKEIVRAIMTREVTHMDFLVLEPGEFVTYRVPFETVGIPVGVKIGGGCLNVVTRTLKVRVARENLVSKISVDVSALEKEQAVFVKDIPFTAGTILTPARQAAALVV